MTNSTTPLPVQEPAGAVEAIMALADAYAEAAQRGEDAMSIARKCSALRSALASLPPVTQAQPDASIPGPGMNASGERVDSANVTQAKSEAVALLPCPNSFVCAGRCDNRCEEGFAPAAIEKQTHFCQAWGSCDYCAICGKAMPVPTGPVAAPQEAVERQPLTREQIEAIDDEVMKSPRDYCMKFARAIETAHGIGPATQEKQHG